jgi:hypothetical protein
MSSGPVAAELSQLLRSGAEQAVDALRRAAAEGLDAGELTELLRVAFTQRNRLGAAVTAAGPRSKGRGCCVTNTTRS